MWFRQKKRLCMNTIFNSSYRITFFFSFVTQNIKTKKYTFILPGSQISLTTLMKGTSCRIFLIHYFDFLAKYDFDTWYVVPIIIFISDYSNTVIDLFRHALMESTKNMNQNKHQSTSIARWIVLLAGGLLFSVFILLVLSNALPTWYEWISGFYISSSKKWFESWKCSF